MTIRIVWIAAGLAGLFFFLGPMLVSRIRNIGNYTGIVLSLLAIVHGYRGSIFPAAFRISSKGHVFSVILDILCLVILVTVAVETVFIVKAANHRPQASMPLIVLGCEVKGTAPSRILKERIHAAEEYLNQYPDSKAVLSGGQGSGEEISEAECMYRSLVSSGIDKDRLIMEDQSVSTEENIANSVKLIKKYKMGDQAAVVTSEFHCCRAEMIAQKNGLKAFSIPAHTAGFYLPTYYVRELYGILYQLFLG